MGISQGRHCPIFLGKSGQICHDAQQLLTEIAQSLPIENEVGVVRHIAAGSTQMDDSCRRGSNLAIGIDVSHDIMANLLLPRRGAGEVNVLNVVFQLCHLLRCDRQAQLMLRAGQRHPEPAPDLDPLFLRKEMQHIFGSIA